MRSLLIFLALSSQLCAQSFSFNDPAFVGQKPVVASGGTTLLTSLVSYWKLDEAIASGTRADATASANDLTDNNNNLAFNNVDFKINNSVTFQGGAGNCFRHADNSSLKLSSNTDFSWQVWMRPDSLGSPRVLVDKGSAFNLNGDEYLIYFSASTTLTCDVGNGSTHASFNSATTYAIHTWYHIVFTYNSAAQQIHLYVNGVEDANSPVSWTGGTQGTTGPLSIGESSATTGNYFVGDIDEVAFWKRAVTSGEVTSLYNSSAGLAYSNFGSTP